jgi:O-antigen/teichoic acid export membrane protein
MSLSAQININTFSQLAGKFFSLIFGFLTTLILRRYLGLVDFGNYIFVITYLTLFISFSDLGTHLVSVSHSAQNKSCQTDILGAVFYLRLLISFFSFILSFLVARIFFPNNLYLLFIICLPLIFLTNFKIFLTIIFHSQLKLYFFSLMDFLLAAFLFFGSILVCLLNLKLKNYFQLMDLSYLFSVLLLGAIAFKIVKINWRFNFKLIKNLFLKSLPLGLILIIYTFYSRIDTFILTFFQGPQVVGIYGLSFRIYENLVLPAAFLMNALLPLISSPKIKNNKKKFYYFYQTSADLLISGSLFLIAIFFFLAPWIIRIFVGQPSQPETTTLKFLLLALPLAFLNHLTGYTIIAINKLKQSLLVSGGALIFNLITNLVLIPKYSYLGAAVNVCLTQGFVLFFNLLIIYKTYNLKINFIKWPETTYLFVKNKGRIFDD